MKEAHAIYESIRRQSRAAAQALVMSRWAMSPVNRLLMFDPKSGDFFQIAERLYDEGNYLYTVVAAQTAFELYMEGVFEYVLHLRSTLEIGAAIGEMIRSYSLDDRRVRSLWEGFTGHKLTEDRKAWHAYKLEIELAPEDVQVVQVFEAGPSEVEQGERSSKTRRARASSGVRRARSR